MNTVGIMKAYAETIIRAISAPTMDGIYGGEPRPAVRARYGLYDRAMGIQYLLGACDAIRYNR